MSLDFVVELSVFPLRKFQITTDIESMKKSKHEGVKAFTSSAVRTTVVTTKSLELDPLRLFGEDVPNLVRRGVVQPVLTDTARS